MNYQQYFKFLQDRCSEAATKFFALEKDMEESDGFGNRSTLPKYAQAKQNMLNAESDFWSFLAFMRARNVKPDDLMYLA